MATAQPTLVESLAAPEAAASAKARPIWRGRDALRRRALAAADTGTLLVASVAAGIASSFEATLWALPCLPAWLVLAKLHGLYDRDHKALRHLTIDEFPSIVGWAITATAVLAAVLAVAPVIDLSVHAAAIVWAATVMSGVGLRAAARWAWRRAVPPERALVVGQGMLAEAIQRKLELFPEMHMDLVEVREDADEIIERPEEIGRFDRLILASFTVDEGMIGDLVDCCRKHDVKLTIIPPSRGMLGSAAQLTHVADLPVIAYNTWNVSRSTLLLKRTLDIAISACTLVLVFPLFVLIGVAIKLDSSGRIIFSQLRAGQQGRVFRMYKFRTMVADAEERLGDLLRLKELEEPVFKLKEDPRVTRVGRILRRTSLDELPQLFNVLRGDMSLVGPRPEQIDVVELYRPEHLIRLKVKPGLTGPMQVFGRGELRFEERLAVEREYIENISIGRDLRILGMTIAAVFNGRGAT